MTPDDTHRSVIIREPSSCGRWEYEDPQLNMM